MSQKKTKQYIPKSVKVTSVPVEKERDGTLPIPETLEKVKGYKSLTIYKMMKSPYDKGTFTSNSISTERY